MANVSLKSIDELFDENFIIPSYQRGYRWTIVQVQELLEDLFDFADSKKDPGDYYCLQPVIVKERQGKWELIDGQQRITALWLISALYFCSNRDDIEDLKYQSYGLEYEEKPLFSKFISDISKMVTQKSLVAVKEELLKISNNCIDSRNLFESIDYIVRFTRKKKTSKGVLAKIFEEIHNVKVIWYVLDAEEDAIQTFTNINANKIELTNAELIKAILLNACEDENNLHSMAIQWENIEKGLNNDYFWNFIVNTKRKNYSTRIDYLFEIWNAKVDNGNGNTFKDRHAVFRAVNSYIESDQKKESKKIWSEIQNAYDMLLDWYNDYFYYHTIGLLIIVSEKEKDVDIIIDLYENYTSQDTIAFRKYILEKIRCQFFGDSKAHAFKKCDFVEIKKDLDNISFSDSFVRNVLLLYNISMLINANNTYERFPFVLYKNETWDIEHINPQTPKEASPVEKQEWLDSYLRIVNDGVDISKDPTLKQDIKNCLKQKLKDFEAIAKRVNNLLKITDNDSITNLVLLDAGTNRGYKNSCFADKRKKIIEVERTTSNDEKYIPIGTKWVFLKGYEKSSQLILWEENDMQDYAKDLAESIYTMLGEK